VLAKKRASYKAILIIIDNHVMIVVFIIMITKNGSCKTKIIKHALS
jgi:hypothetical protein